MEKRSENDNLPVDYAAVIMKRRDFCPGVLAVKGESSSVNRV